MRKISIHDLENGMVIAADVFGKDFGADLPLIGRGVALTEKYIAKMKECGIMEILVVTPPGYRGAPGETMTLVEVTQDIVSEGSLDLQCNIPPGVKVAASENISIAGTVTDGCSIISAKGDIVIIGGVAGSDDNRVTVHAGNRITITESGNQPITCADIKGIDQIVSTGDMLKCSLSSKGSVHVNGKVVETNIYSHKEIRVQACGDSNGQPSKLLVKPAKCRVLFQKLLTLDKELALLQKEKQRLHNSIHLVRSICKDINLLPQDKKMELALEVKKSQETDAKITNGTETKEQFKWKIITILAVQRIFIDKRVQPKTYIAIENCSLILEEQQESVAFNVQDMKVNGIPFQ